MKTYEIATFFKLGYKEITFVGGIVPIFKLF